MTMWILVAVFGGILSVVGFVTLVRRYRQGVIRGRYLMAFVVGAIVLLVFDSRLGEKLQGLFRLALTSGHNALAEEGLAVEGQIVDHGVCLAFGELVGALFPFGALYGFLHVRCLCRWHARG